MVHCDPRIPRAASEYPTLFRMTEKTYDSERVTECSHGLRSPRPPGAVSTTRGILVGHRAI